MEYCTSQYGNMECNNLDFGLFYLAIALIPIAFIIFYVFKLTISTNRCPKCGKRISEYSDYCNECEKYAQMCGFNCGFNYCTKFGELTEYLSEEKNIKLFSLAYKIWTDGTKEQYLEFREKLKEIFKKAKKIEYIKKQKEISKLAKELNIRLKGGSDEMEMEDLEKYLLGGLVGYIAGDKEILKTVKSKVKNLLSDDASEKKSTKE